MSKLSTFISICFLIAINSVHIRINKETQINLLPGLPKLNLGTAAGFAVLSEAGITDVSPSAITGNVGSSPITGAAILLTCPEVTGIIYAVDANGPPCFTTSAPLLSAAIGDMGIAYTAANLLVNPAFIEFNLGDISGYTLVPGLYKWSSGININADVTLNGSPTDVWVFQIAGDITQANGTHVNLTGGAVPANVFWIVAGAYVDIGINAVFQGTILAKGAINLLTGATVYGRLLAQTAITLQMNTIVAPKLN